MIDQLATNWQPIAGPFTMWQTLQLAVDQAGYESQRLAMVYPDTRSTQPLLMANTICLPADQVMSASMGMVTANPALKVIAILSADQLLADWPTLQQLSTENHNLTLLVIDSPSASDCINQTILSLLSNLDCWQARAFVGDSLHMQQLYQAAIRHDGLSLLSILVPTSSENDLTYQAIRSRLFALQSDKNKIGNWPATDRAKAYQMLSQPKQRIDVGLLHASPGRPSYQKVLLKGLDGALVDQPFKTLSLKNLLP